MDNTQKIAAIVGITEAVKQYGVPSKFCPTIAIIVGAMLGYAGKPNSNGILEGVILGATVTGGYAVFKRSARGVIAPFKKNSWDGLDPDDDRGV